MQGEQGDLEDHRALSVIGLCASKRRVLHTAACYTSSRGELTTVNENQCALLIGYSLFRAPVVELDDLT